MTINRAYSLLEVKAVDDEKRIIEGIASTPQPDRLNDIVDLDGMEFRTPLPFLWQHNSRQPIGTVLSAKKTKDGLTIKAQIAQDIVPFIAEAWALIKAGLVRGLSIGFRSLEDSWDRERGGINFIRTELFEISAVTIPANAEASILSVKSIDTTLRAALGIPPQKRVVKLDATHRPGVSGNTEITIMTIKEQITALENKRAAADARQEELTKKAADEGRTFDEAESDEYKDLDTEIASIDEHLTLLRKREKRLVATATAVTQETAGTEKKGADARQGVVVVKQQNLPKGIGVARMAIAMVRANNNAFTAMDIARKLWPDQPEVELALKAVVEAGDTTTSGWASQLVPAAQQMQEEFLELLRPATIIGRIPNLRRVPFNISIPIETASGTATWVGEGAPKPVTKLTLSSVTLRWAKAAAIVVITKELAKFSRPDAELVVRNSMVKTLVRFFDTHFVSATAEVTNVSPAGILNGISAVAASGTTASAFRADFNNMLNNFTANHVPLTDIVILMSSTQAVALSLMVTDLGVPLFPNITREGGSILGFPVIVSEAVGTKIIAVNANEILIAEDPAVDVSVSDSASVEMDTEPVVGETSPVTQITTLKSFWQNNLIGVKVEQFSTWKRGRDSAVEFISGNAYVPS